MTWRIRTLFEAPDEPFTTGTLRVTDTTTPARFTRDVILAAKRYTVPSALLIVVHQLGEALVPVIMGLAIDRALGTGDVRELLLWVAVLAADFAALSMAFRFGSRIGLYGMQAVQHQLRMMVSDRLLHPRGMGGPAALPGASLSIATSDVFILAAALRIGTYPLGQLVAVCFCAAMLLGMSWLLGLAVLVGTGLTLTVMGLAGGPLRRRSQASRALGAEAVGVATDFVTGYRVLKGVRAEKQAGTRYERVSQDALRATLHAKSAEGGYDATMGAITAVFIAAIALGAGLLAVHGTLSVGELIAVVGLTQFLIEPLRSLSSQVGAVWAMSVASATRVLSVLQAPYVLAERAADARFGPHVRPQLELRGAVVHDCDPITLHAAPGEHLGVIASAEQAHALVTLLALRADAETGSVLVGGHDLGALDPVAARSVLLVAPHEADLFEGSIEDNVRGAGAGDDAVAAALSAAGCDELVESLPEGRDSAVGESGTRLSGGQRQRVALARALAAQAPVLVLHDPTTALDSVTEAQVAAGVRAARAGATTVLITSSPPLLGACDRVVDLRTDKAAG